MIIVILLVAAIIGYFLWKTIKAGKNSTVEFDDNHFTQAGVNVEFKSGTIRIKEHTYNVNQITGILAEPYTSNRSGDSSAWKAIIEVDDFKTPRHQMNFLSRKKANEFTQRLSTALRKAGGPSFS